MIQATEKIWHNGKMIPWDEARVHVLTHALHYGTSVFEGIRCYSTPEGPAIFRAKEHVRRLFDSCKVYRMDDFAFSQEELIAALRELVKGKRAGLLLSSPNRVSRLRRDRSSLAEEPHRDLHRLLGVGQVSWP